MLDLMIFLTIPLALLLAIHLLRMLFIFVMHRFTNRAKGKLPPDLPLDAGYRVYTTDFDVEIASHELPFQLGAISPDKNRGMLEGAQATWLDNAAAFDAIESRAVPDRSSAAPPIAITLLVDQSNSIAGHKLAKLVAAIRDIADWLHRSGISHEILGYTTAGWHGGFARDLWLNSSAQPYPGRLAALLHVVYKDFGQEKLEPESLRVMLHPGARRENIDGEAMEWAIGRLHRQQIKRRLLVVLSDGSPVDDSTLLANGGLFLDRHLQSVISQVQDAGDIELAAVGIGYNVEGWYASAHSVGDDDDYLAGILDYLNDLIDGRAAPARNA